MRGGTVAGRLSSGVPTRPGAHRGSWGRVVRIAHSQASPIGGAAPHHIRRPDPISPVRPDGPRRTGPDSGGGYRDADGNRNREPRANSLPLEYSPDRDYYFY